MGVTWVGDTLKVVLDRSVTSTKNQVVNSILDIMVDVAEMGAIRMADIIETTPSSINPSLPDRVDTGLMLNSVAVDEITKLSKDYYRTAFGWTDLVESYFLTQEYGGMSQGLRTKEQIISPMHALTGAFIQAREELFRKGSAKWG